MNEFNICGVLVHAKPDCADKVKSVLCTMQGVEVHQVGHDGRMVVTVESEDRRYVSDTLTSFYSVDGVLSACMVYQFSDEITATEGEMSA
jgi:nitrate reductase NapD